MNLTKLKNYAPAARSAFIEAVTRRAGVLGIRKDRVEEVSETGDIALIGGQPIPRSVVPLRKKLLDHISVEGFDAVMEAMAYTWFNRFVAFRFMELHGYFDHGYRVLSHPEGGLLPEIVQHAEHVSFSGLDQNEVIRLKLAGNKDEELYRLLILAQCQEMNRLLPDIFSRLDDATILLLPDNLLHTDSLVRQLVAASDPEDWQEVEVLGWLYQFYISEKKDIVMARKSAVPKEDIPAVTQLFTPHWIVRYLVENSLGRLWLLNRPGSRLRDHMPYYIEPAPPEPPAWQADWQDRIQFTEQDFKTWMWLRPNASFQDDYDATLGYATTIDGQAYGRTRWGIETFDGSGGTKVEELILADLDKAGFEDLRYCLFVLQRGIKWLGGGGPVDDLIEKFHAVHGVLCKAWDREWSGHTTELPDLSIVGVTATSTETDFLKITKPEDIRLCDPAVGSGHMLTYAFDLLYLIYEEEGYLASEIPSLILRHNLHGLEICPRAAQLAELSLVFKARAKSRRFFQPEHFVRPQITELQDLRFAEGELRDYIQALSLGELFNEPMLKLLHQFEEAKNFGSLIQPCVDAQTIAYARGAIATKGIGDQLFLSQTHPKVLRVLDQAEALTQRYHVVVANPPYMGGVLNGVFANFIQSAFPDSTNDLSAAFVPRCLGLTVSCGLAALVTMHSWMFVSTLETLRRRLLAEQQIVNLVHHGIGAFPSLNSKVVQTAAFVMKQSRPDKPPVFLDIREVAAADKDAASGEKKLIYSRLTQDQILGLPIATMAYWLTPRKATIFAEGSALSLVSKPRAGISTGGNEFFIRYWFEPSLGRISFSASSRQADVPFYPHNKAGGFRKWYGYASFLLRYDDAALSEMELRPGFRHDNSGFYFKESVSWGKVTSGAFSARFYPTGFTFDGAGLAIFPEAPFPFLGLLNSIVFTDMIAALSQTLNFTVGDIGRFPLENLTASLGEPARLAYEVARTDWDNFETSWDFRDPPLLRSGLKGATLEASWQNWEAQSTAAIRRMQELETENNRLFIAAYGLEGELQPEVLEEQITLARAEPKKDMAAFLSYAIGCMMGRYSLARPGLVLADAEGTLEDYRRIVGNDEIRMTNDEGQTAIAIPMDSSFQPDTDGISPITELPWFEDDVALRVEEFLRVTFGPDTLEANLDFLARSLGPKGQETPRDTLRRHLADEFYKNHLSNERAYGYKNRPIYWLFRSGKEGAFQCLVYLHRYHPGTLARMRTEYVIPLQGKLNARVAHLEEEKTHATSTSQRTKLQKEQDKLKKQQVELLKFDEQLRHYADQRIALDLDDGVKVNYAKFGPLVAEAKKVCGTKEED